MYRTMKEIHIKLLQALEYPKTKNELCSELKINAVAITNNLQMLKKSEYVCLAEGKKWTRTELAEKTLNAFENQRSLKDEFTQIHQRSKLKAAADTYLQYLKKETERNSGRTVEHMDKNDPDISIRTYTLLNELEWFIKRIENCNRSDEIAQMTGIFKKDIVPEFKLIADELDMTKKMKCEIDDLNREKEALSAEILHLNEYKQMIELLKKENMSISTLIEIMKEAAGSDV